MDTTSLPQHPCIRQIRHSRPGDNHEPILRSNGRQTSTISSSSGPWQQPSNTTSGFTNMTVWMSPSPPLPTPIHQALENEVTAHSQTLQKLQSEFLLRTTAQRELRDFHEFAAKRTSEYDQCWQELCRYRESYAQLMLEVENLRTQLETSNSIWEHLRVSEYRRPNSKVYGTCTPLEDITLIKPIKVSTRFERCKARGTSVDERTTR